MPAVAPRAALWDLDGTLVDSADAHFESWRAVLAAEGVEFSHERFLETFGQRSTDTLRRLLGDRPSDERIAALALEKEERYRAIVRTRGASLLPGAGRWLEALAAAGWRQAIVSSAPRANVDTLLEALGIGARFDGLVSGDDVRAGKPAPDAFLAAAARLDVAPARAVAVEDAPQGLEAARRAGMRTIGVLTTHDALAADVVVPSLDALPADAFARLVP